MSNTMSASLAAAGWTNVNDVRKKVGKSNDFVGFGSRLQDWRYFRQTSQQSWICKKLNLEAVLASSPKVQVELSEDVVAGAPKVCGAPVVSDPKVGADVIAMLKLGLAGLVVLPNDGEALEQMDIYVPVAFFLSSI